MSNVEGESDIEEMHVLAKKIDKGLHNLDKKLSNVKTLGLSLAPEEMKNFALDVLKKFEDEIISMREDVERCLEQNRKVLSGCMEDNENVSKYIEQLKNDLDAWEKSMTLKMGRDYQPFQEPIVKEMENNLENDSKSRENETLDSNCVSEAHPNVSSDSFEYDEKINGDFQGGDSNISNENVNMTPPSMISGSPSKNSERSFSSYVPSTLSTRKKVSNVEDVLKTPVDPGLSVASMKLLGKSNIKTKIYKANF